MITIFLVFCREFCMLTIMVNTQFKNLKHSDLSLLRAQFVRLLDEARGLGQKLMEDRPLMRGTVYEMKRKCGGTNCVCVTEGKLHAAMVITWSENGKTRLKGLPELDVGDYRRLTECYREFKQVRKRMEKVFSEASKLIDRVEKKKRREP